MIDAPPRPDHRHRLVAAGLISLLLLVGLGGSASALRDVLGQGGRTTVAVTVVDGAITPVIADHLADIIPLAARDGHQAIIVQLDTPGGLVTSMRDIVQTFLAADLAVVVHVTPRGADAGSAGTFVTYAAHIAAMSPATTIGAATPVSIEGGEVGDKIVNNAAAYAEAIANERGRDVEFAVDAVRDGRSITADEALDIGAIDLIAGDLDDLLEAIDGREVTLADGSVTMLETANAEPVEYGLSGTRRLLQALADPNLAFIFISLGTLAIIYEIANPGLGAGGVAGAIFLILAFFALSVLPVNYAGAALFLLAGILFVIELFMPGIGVAAAGGSVALLVGGLFLFQRPTGIGIDLAVIVPTVLAVMGLTIVAGRLVARARGRAPVSYADDLIGVVAPLALRHDGSFGVRIDGTWWRADPADGQDPAPGDGDLIEVVGREQLTLLVAMAEAPEQADTGLER